MEKNSQTLIIVPAIGAWSDDEGHAHTTNKFLSGIERYCEYWDGPIKVLMRLDKKPNSNMDNIKIEFERLPFELVVSDQKFTRKDIEKGGVVLLNPIYDNVYIPDVCLQANIPYVCIFEYSLKTQFQALLASRVNPLIKLRRMIWLLGQERRIRKIIKNAAGLHCNGSPTYISYQNLNSNRLLYWDNRISDEDVISDTRLSERLNQLDKGGPLRLGFSGRLSEMKGADHLIDFAIALKARQVEFVLSIFGAGVLENEMKSRIIQHQLEQHVIMEGVLDFKDELVPRVANTIDLFICCHRQGDPSCTYIETLSCGVPIFGYANEAFEGLLLQAEIGESVKLDDYDSLAARVADISNHREQLKRYANNGLEFARKHLFEKNFEERTKHLKRIASGHHD